MTSFIKARFIIIRKANGLYYMKFKAHKGRIILTSEGYTSKKGCIEDVEEAKLNAMNDAGFERLISSNGKFYFILKAPYGRAVGISKTYESAAKMNGDIEFVKSAAPTASLVENSN